MELKEEQAVKYSCTCPLCNIKITGFNKKQVEWNYNIHFQKCKKTSKSKKEIKK